MVVYALFVPQVVVLQAYSNDNNSAIEAKYVFPLDDMAVVCGFEAFINGKHVIGEFAFVSNYVYIMCLLNVVYSQLLHGINFANALVFDEQDICI